MNAFLSQTEREVATALATQLGLVFLSRLAATQEQRDTLPPEFCWAEDLLTRLEAEAVQVLAEEPGLSSEVRGAVVGLILADGAAQALQDLTR